jgi:hypothetical protein
MSAPSSAAARLAFFGMADEPEAASTRSHVDAVASGHVGTRPMPTHGRKQYRSPEAEHVTHGRIPVDDHGVLELRVTTRAGRLWVRLWRKNPNGAWWPVRDAKGVQIRRAEIVAFQEAVSLACEVIEKAGDL